MEAYRVPLFDGSEFHSKRPNSRRYLLNSMREEFIKGLPEKVKGGLDPERPFHVDLSRTEGLVEGKYFTSSRVFRSPVSIGSCMPHLGEADKILFVGFLFFVLSWIH